MYKLKTTRKTRKANRKKNIKRAGGQLPIVPAGIIKLPPISSLENIDKNKIKNLNQTGGLLPKGYVGATWGTLVLSNFPINDENLKNFRRLASKPPTDCVISALQIIGILDFFTANVLRITKIGRGTGIDANEIESIFSLRANQRFLFMPTNDVNEFAEHIKKYLPSGSVSFCGVTYTNGLNHVFLIGKDSNGNIIKIDPQVVDSYCLLYTDACFRTFSQNTRQYWLLFNYTGYLTEYEKQELDIVTNPVFNIHSPVDIASQQSDEEMDVD